jgi:hypothetical protein
MEGVMSVLLAAAAGVAATAVAVFLGVGLLEAVMLALGRVLERPAGIRAGALWFERPAIDDSRIGIKYRALPSADSAVDRRK